jgi:hypothetical protein
MGSFIFGWIVLADEVRGEEGFSVPLVAKETAEKTLIAACGGKAPGLKP